MVCDGKSCCLHGKKYVDDEDTIIVKPKKYIDDKDIIIVKPKDKQDKKSRKKKSSDRKKSSNKQKVSDRKKSSDKKVTRIRSSQLNENQLKIKLSGGEDKQSFRLNGKKLTKKQLMPILQKYSSKELFFGQGGAHIVIYPDSEDEPSPSAQKNNPNAKYMTLSKFIKLYCNSKIKTE